MSVPLLLKGYDQPPKPVITLFYHLLYSLIPFPHSVTLSLSKGGTVTSHINHTSL